jgi:hypothetical protein
MTNPLKHPNAVRWTTRLMAAALALGLCPVQENTAVAQSGGVNAPVQDETYAVDLKIIEAYQLGGADGGATPLDPQLAGLAKELRTLPFKGYTLLDGLQKDLKTSEAFTAQFGRPERMRFLRVQAVGKKDGKVKLDVSMESARKKKPRVEFKSEVSITEGSTLVVVAQRSQPGPRDSVILLAISARTLPGNTGTAGGPAGQAR